VNKFIKNLLFIFWLVMIFVCSCFLFWHQAVSDGSSYLSDLPIHIEVSIHETGYSLMNTMFRVLYVVYPHNITLAAGLAAVTVMTIYAVFFLMKVMLEQMNVNVQTRKSALLFFSISSLFITSIYIPFLYPHFYDRAWSTQPWHNSTYLLMRLLGVLALAVYFQIEAHYLDGIRWKDFVLFTVLLTLVNYAKPNFIIGFAPMMLIFLIKDFIRMRGHGVQHMIKFGSCVLLSLWILVIQYKMLYPVGGNSAVAVTGERLKIFLSSPISIVQAAAGLAFPIVILCMAVRMRYFPSFYVKSLVMYLITLLEWIFLTETGPRANHGNFGWGTLLGAFILYLSSCAVLLSLYNKNKISKKIYLASWAVYAASIISGLCYFSILLRGGGYVI